MGVIRSGNFMFKEPPFEDGDVVERGNFCQLRPGTEICKHVRNLTVNGGNFANCKPQPSWKVLGGNWAQMSYCTNVRPDLIRHGLAKCPVDCEHRIGTEKQWTDVQEREFRSLKAEARLGTFPDADLRTVENPDEDGVIVQQLQCLRYRYAHLVVGNNRPRSVKGVG